APTRGLPPIKQGGTLAKRTLTWPKTISIVAPRRSKANDVKRILPDIDAHDGGHPLHYHGWRLASLFAGGQEHCRTIPLADNLHSGAVRESHARVGFSAHRIRDISCDDRQHVVRCSRSVSLFARQLGTYSRSLRGRGALRWLLLAEVSRSSNGSKTR